MAMYNYFLWPFDGDSLDFMSSKGPGQFQGELFQLTYSSMFLEIFPMWNLIPLCGSVDRNTFSFFVLGTVTTMSPHLFETSFWVIKDHNDIQNLT